MSDMIKVTQLKKYIGQERLIALLLDEVEASIGRGLPLPNMLFGGPPGLGKTSLIASLAQARGVQALTIMGPQFREDLLAFAITKSFNSSGHDDQGYICDRTQIKPSILFIDEAESVDLKLWEILHNIMEPDREGRRLISVKVPRLSQRKLVWCPAVTVIIATNYVGKLRKKAEAAVNRCGIKWMFEPYSIEQLVTILHQMAKDEHIDLDQDAALKIASRSIGIPRTAKSLLTRCINRHVASIRRGHSKSTSVTLNVVQEALNLMGIDDLGLERPSREYLKALAQDPAGKVGVESIAAITGVDKETIMVDIEPFLMKQGLVRVVPGGRQITEEGLIHIGSDQANPLHRHIISNI